MRCLKLGIIAGALMLAQPAPVAAQSPVQDGDWMGFAVTGIFLGLVVPAFEQLQISGNDAIQRAWAIPLTDGGCRAAPDDPPACAPPIAIGAAKLGLAGERLSVTPAGPQVAPYTHPTDLARWPDLALAGQAWLARGDDRRLILSREAEIEGEPTTLERIYYRVGPDTTGQVFDYLRSLDLSLGQAICCIDALHAEPELWAGFEADLARLAPVTAEMRRLTDRMPLSRGEQLRYLTLRNGPEAMGSSAADVSDLPEAARLDWLARHQRLMAGGDAGDGEVWLPLLGLPVPGPMAERAQACIEYVSGL